MTVETVDDFFTDVAREAAEKFPDLGIVVVGLQGKGDDAKICSITNLDAEDAVDLVTHVFEADSEGDEVLNFPLGMSQTRH